MLKLIHTARARGISVIFITHNVHHAYPIGDTFTLLNRGKSLGTFTKDDHQQGRSARHDGRRRRDAEDDRRTRRREDLIHSRGPDALRPPALSYSGHSWIIPAHPADRSSADLTPARQPASRFAPGRSRDIVCLGRLAVDLYAQQVGARLEDVSSFAKYLGGSSANIAFGCARLGLASSMLARVGDDHMGRFLTET